MRTTESKTMAGLRIWKWSWLENFMSIGSSFSNLRWRFTKYLMTIIRLLVTKVTMIWVKVPPLRTRCVQVCFLMKSLLSMIRIIQMKIIMMAESIFIIVGKILSSTSLANQPAGKIVWVRRKRSCRWLAVRPISPRN